MTLKAVQPKPSMKIKYRMVKTKKTPTKQEPTDKLDFLSNYFIVFQL